MSRVQEEENKAPTLEDVRAAFGDELINRFKWMEQVKEVAEDHANNPGNTRSTMLDLWWKEIGDEGAKALAANLHFVPQLKELKVAGNSIGDEGAKALAANLRFVPQLNRLYVSYNSIGDDGAKALAANLRFVPQLTVLNAHANSIGDEGAKALAANLRFVPQLKVLYVTANSIGDEGAKALAANLRFVPQLTINLARNDVKDPFVQQLVDAMNNAHGPVHAAVEQFVAHAVAESPAAVAGWLWPQYWRLSRRCDPAALSRLLAVHDLDCAGASPVVVCCSDLVPIDDFVSLADVADLSIVTPSNPDGLSLSQLASASSTVSCVDARGFQLFSSDLDLLATLPLHVLDVSGCGLTSLQELSSCRTLRWVVAAHNSLDAVPHELCSLTELDLLFVDGNPCVHNAGVSQNTLTNPRTAAELVRKGGATEEWKVVSVIMFGNGRAGKTTTVASVCKRLSWFNSDVVQQPTEPSTRIKFNEPFEDASGLEFVFVDMPGQTQATSFNSMCYGALTQSVALVVVRLYPAGAAGAGDARLTETQVEAHVRSQARMWLTMARTTFLEQRVRGSFSAHSSTERMGVVLVATHVDQAHKETYERLLPALHGELKAEFGDTLDLDSAFHAINARSAKAAAEVRRHMRELGKKVVAQRPPMATWLVQARERFMRDCRPRRLMSKVEVLEYCERELSLTPGLVDALVDVLAASGSVVTAHQTRFVVTDAGWLSEVLFQLVPEPGELGVATFDKLVDLADSKQLAAPRQGVVSEELLRLAVERVASSKSVDAVVKLLRTLDFVQPLSVGAHKRTWFIPARLAMNQENAPVTFASPEPWLERMVGHRFKYVEGRDSGLADVLCEGAEQQLSILPLRVWLEGSVVPSAMLMSRVMSALVTRLGESRRRFVMSRFSFVCVFDADEYCTGEGVEKAEGAWAVAEEEPVMRVNSQEAGAEDGDGEDGDDDPEQDELKRDDSDDDATSAPGLGDAEMAIWVNFGSSAASSFDVVLVVPRDRAVRCVRPFVYDVAWSVMLQHHDPGSGCGVRVKVRRLCCGCAATRTCVVDEHTEVEHEFVADGDGTSLDRDSMELLCARLAEMQVKEPLWRDPECAWLSAGALDVQAAGSSELEELHARVEELSSEQAAAARERAGAARERGELSHGQAEATLERAELHRRQHEHGERINSNEAAISSIQLDLAQQRAWFCELDDKVASMSGELREVAHERRALLDEIDRLSSSAQHAVASGRNTAEVEGQLAAVLGNLQDLEMRVVSDEGLVQQLAGSVQTNHAGLARRLDWLEARARERDADAAEVTERVAKLSALGPNVLHAFRCVRDHLESVLLNHVLSQGGHRVGRAVFSIADAVVNAADIPILSGVLSWAIQEISDADSARASERVMGGLRNESHVSRLDASAHVAREVAIEFAQCYAGQLNRLRDRGAVELMSDSAVAVFVHALKYWGEADGVGGCELSSGELARRLVGFVPLSTKRFRTAWWTKKLSLVDESVKWSVEGVFRRSGVRVVVGGEEQLFGHSDGARFKVKYGFHGGWLEEVEARELVRVDESGEVV